MIERDGRHAPPEVCRAASVLSAARPYHSPTLTVYGSVRDLTRGTGIGKPDNPGTQSHSKPGPFGVS